MRIISTIPSQVRPVSKAVNERPSGQSIDFGEIPRDDYHKETRTTRVLFGDKHQSPYPNELALRKEIAEHEKLFETDPKKDLDPSAQRYFDGELSVEISEAGAEVAVLEKAGLRQELVRENGRLSSLRSREIVDGLIKDTSLLVGDWSAKKVESTFTSRTLKRERSLGTLREGFLVAAELTGGMAAILGLGLLMARNGGL